MLRAGCVAALATPFLWDEVCGITDARWPHVQIIALRVRAWRTRNLLLRVALVHGSDKTRHGAQGRLLIPMKHSSIPNCIMQSLPLCIL
jgi:hypothetical protein